MELNPKLQHRALKTFQEAVCHQGKVWDLALELSELLGLEGLNEVLPEVQAHSITSDTGRDLTWQDLEGLIAAYQARGGLE
jgi:hypothetical protein